MRAWSVPEMFSEDLKREQYTFADNMSVLLTHLSEVIRNNLPQLLSYKDMKALLDRQDPEYKKLADEICTSHITYPGLQAVLKLLLAERVSIRNLHLIIEAIAEIAPHVRRTEQIVEHVRIRMAQQICGDLSEAGVLKVLRLGNRWDLAFHQSLKRDAKGEVREFDIDPRQLEEFGQDASKAIRNHLDAGERFVLVTAPDARPYVRMIVERLFPTLPVLSPCRDRQGRRAAHPRNDLLTATVEGAVIAAFLAFCRIGACFLVMPGLSSVRVPIQVRLFVALAATGGLLVLLWDQIYPFADRRPEVLVPRIASELLIGVLIGLLARLYILALQFMGAAIAMLIGYGGTSGPGIEDGEPQAALAAIVSFSALLLLFIFDFHHEIIRALVASYQVAPLDVLFNPQAALVDVTDTLSESFLVVLRLGSPFVAYSLLVNLTIGFVNKLVPQIPVYFISLPFVIAAGLIIFYFAIGTMLSLFADGFVGITIGR